MLMQQHRRRRTESYHPASVPSSSEDDIRGIMRQPIWRRLPSRLRPSVQHTPTTLSDVLAFVVTTIHTTTVRVAAAIGDLEEQLASRPGVLCDCLDLVVAAVESDGVGCLEVFPVDGVVGVGRHVHHQPGTVFGGVEDVGCAVLARHEEVVRLRCCWSA